MNSAPNTLTRRAALLGTLKGAVAATLALPVVADSAEMPPITPESEFIPENDYPFFGHEPDTACAREMKFPEPS